MTILRDEKLRITQRVHSKWSEIFDDRDDAEANDAYFKMYEVPWPRLRRSTKIGPPTVKSL